MTTINEETSLQLYDEQPQTRQGNPLSRTLLPWPIARGVSAATGLLSLNVRVATKLVGWGLTIGQQSTLTTIELSRATLEGILIAAGRDVTSRRNGELGQREAENILETSIRALHSFASTTSYLASVGFYTTTTTMHNLSDLSSSGLSTLNALLGETETSRAVAGILTLLREEMKRAPDGSVKGETVGYTDLFIGIIGFVLLQRWGRRKTERDFRDNGGEEIIWDTVLDDKGFRADVIVSSRKETYDSKQKNGRRMSFVNGDEHFEALERGTLYESANLSMSPEEQTTLSDEEIRAHIVGQLPPGARAVITSETITAKTIKVQIYNSDPTHVEAPPGTVMVAERLNHRDGSGESDSFGAPHQTVVFRTALKRSSSADINLSTEKLRLTSTNDDRDEDQDSGDDLVMQDSPGTKRKFTSPVPGGDVSLEEIASRHPPLIDALPKSSGPVANQKKPRKPDVVAGNAPTATRSPPSKIPTSRIGKDKSKANGRAEKNGAFKKALKSLSPSSSSTAIKDIGGSSNRGGKGFMSNNVLSSSIPRMTATPPKDSPVDKRLPAVPSKRSSASIARSGFLSPSSPRSVPGQNYFTVHEKRRDSVVSQTDTYSTHSVDSRPGSPTYTRTHVRSTSGLTKTKSATDFEMWNASESRPSTPPDGRHHQRSKSFVPSLYSMATKGSEEAIILAPKKSIPRQSIFEDSAILTALVTDGKAPGMFPHHHLLHNARRFSRFASASYGANFLRVMGLVTSEFSKSTELQKVDVHHEHNSFSMHTGLPSDTIILSSFVDPQGVTGNTEWSSSVFSPLIHYIAIDHDSKAVVLTCRGTLGFEDVLTDMTCDYDDLYWQGEPYRVHKGIHASAKRLLGGGNGSRVMATIKATLEEYPDFGLVLCGHSLGGAVAAMLAILISEPSPTGSTGTAFVTSTVAPKLLISSGAHDSAYHMPPITLPPNRAVHVYSFGTPACVSEDLRLATRGLITSVINSNDFFASLSIGTLHDFRGVALNLKTDTTGALDKLRLRVHNRVKYAIKNMFYNNPGPPPTEHWAGDGLNEDTWAWAALKTLRAGMTSEKLVPAGEVFVLETMRVFDKSHGPSVAAGFDSETERVYRTLGRPATRIQFRLIRDVEGRFGELRFNSQMFGDHLPGRYEANLAALESGVLDL